MSHPNLTVVPTVKKSELRRRMSEGLGVPISLLVQPLPQPSKIRSRASRSTVRASRSLPYPDGKYERRRRAREANIDRRFEQFEADIDRRFHGAGNHEGYALRLAMKGSGRRDITD